MTQMSTLMLDLKDSLHSLVICRFNAARKSNDLIFSDTELSIIRNGQGIPFQLRYCPALAKKPGAISKDTQHSKERPRPDPFEQPPVELLVAEVPRTKPSHVLVLNKYPVIENHFILASKKLKQQTHLLEPDDLDIAYACLQAWAGDAPKNEPRRLFAFFNSGEHSGASQAHRHLQFLPLENMTGHLQDEWQLLTDGMTATVPHCSPVRRNPDLPFLHYAVGLSQGISADDLHTHYLSLLRAAIDDLKSNGIKIEHGKTELTDQNGDAAISYNLAMTTDTMAMMPRRSETGVLTLNDHVLGSVAINGTILGGTLMVKDEHEWAALKETPGVLDEMVTTIGYPVSENGSLDRTKL